MLANGVSSVWPSQNPCLHTPLVCKTGNSSWTSISAILATHMSMPSTSVIGCNITLSAISKILYLPQTHTLFAHPIHQRTVQHITSYVPFGYGSTWHISTYSSMGHSSLPQPRVAKHETASPRLIGMLWRHTSTFPITLSRNSMFNLFDSCWPWHTRLYSRWCHISSTGSLNIPRWRRCPRYAPLPVTKDHGIQGLLPPIFLFLFIVMCLFGHAVVDQLDVHFARKSEKCEHMEHCDESLAFQLHLSPCLAYDSACIAKYFGPLKGVGLPIARQDCLNHRLTFVRWSTHASLQKIWRSSIFGGVS